MKTKNKRGISLIVLIITIIVMIILAATIILSISGIGIIDEANKAVKKSDLANAKNVVALSQADWELMSETERTAERSFSAYATNKLAEAGFKTGAETGALEVSEEGDIYVYPTIPEGFVASTYTGETKVSEGLVIYEVASLTGVAQSTAMTDYNQYVWIPVPEISEFVRRGGYYNYYLERLDTTTEPFSKTTSDGITLSEVNDLTGEYAEYSKMKASVEKKGGFYIARYEAGKEGTDTVVSKKEATVWDNIPWGTSMTEVGTNGAVYYSRNMYPEDENYDIVSTLIYGVQWDAVMNFMKDVENPNVKGKKYIEDSTGMGWYARNAKPTGVDLNENALNKVKNIYDMAGNVGEWTMEAMHTFSRVARGCYGGSGTSGRFSPASVRDDSGVPPEADYWGFRVALYLK